MNYSYQLPVREIIRFSPNAAAIRFNLDGNPFSFLPGQFAQLEAEIPNPTQPGIQKQKRCYSISSSPNESNYIELTVKLVHNGLFSEFLVNKIKVGDMINLTGPCGTFFFNEKTSKPNIIFIAAGSGIAPAMSILRYLNEKRPNINATLLYSNKTEEEILWRGEIQYISANNPRINHLFTLTQQQWQGRTGRIDRNLIFQYCIDKIKTDFFLCGPPPFVFEMEKLLQESGIAQDAIKHEMF